MPSLKDAEKVAASAKKHVILVSRTGVEEKIPSSAVHVMGSVRRKVPNPNDVDLLVILTPHQMNRLDAGGSLTLKAPGYDITKQVASGARRSALRLKITGAPSMKVDLFTALVSEMPYALFHFTGDKIYNIRVRAHAKKNGMKLNQYGLFYAGSNRAVRGSRQIKTERELCKMLGITYKEPELRNEK